MLCRQFLTWAERAPAGERAEAARALASAYLYSDLDPIEQGETERTMTCLLDDPSALVRRALAEALAPAVDAPHHLVSALANDQADVAVPVLARSPLLDDAELIDAAALGEASAQCAIAARPALSAAVAGALAEVGTREAVLVLCRNDGATLADVSAARIVERFGRDGDVREALGQRRDLTGALRERLVAATAETLLSFVTGCGWMSPERARRVSGESAERATIVLARATAERDGADGLKRFTRHLRDVGRLTPALMLRALLGGDVGLFEGALSDLSGQALGRVSALLAQRGGLGFSALYRAAGLPETLMPAFRHALDAVRSSDQQTLDPTLERRAVARVIAAVGPASGASALTALLRRLESEAMREETRRIERNAATAPRPRLAEFRSAA